MSHAYINWDKSFFESWSSLEIKIAKKLLLIRKLFIIKVLLIAKKAEYLFNGVNSPIVAYN